MKKYKAISVLTAIVITFSTALPAAADWRFESNNSTSGLSAYASSYWINGIGPVNYSGLMNYDLPYETYYAALLIQCLKKKYVVSFSLMQTGSAHDSMALDDPGYIRLQFLNTKLNQKSTYRTYGLGLEGALAINTNTQNLVSNISKSRTLKMQFIKRSGKVLNATFDTRDLALGKTRFAYAGCKF